jgi:hypothetical protein
MAPPDVFQEWGRAIQLAYSLKVDIARARAVVATSTIKQCDLPGGANAEMLGVTLVDGLAGENRPIVLSNGVVLVTASAAIAVNDPLQIADNQGRMKTVVPPGALTQIDAQAVVANSAALSKNAVHLIAVKATAGGVTGWMKILPKGSVPGAGEVALDNAGANVLFNNADAVTAATLEYVINNGVGTIRVCGIALGSASGAGTQLPMLIARFRM